MFDGSLDRLAGGRLDYAAEFEQDCVHEAGRDWFIQAQSNAEVWAYIDEKLVMVGGGPGGVRYRIENGAVVTTEPCEAEITVVGSAIQSGSTPCPVTVRASAGCHGGRLVPLSMIGRVVTRPRVCGRLWWGPEKG